MPPLKIGDYLLIIRWKIAQSLPAQYKNVKSSSSLLHGHYHVVKLNQN